MFQCALRLLHFFAMEGCDHFMHILIVFGGMKGSNIYTSYSHFELKLWILMLVET